MEQNCNPSILEVEAGEHKLKTSLGYIRKSTFKSKWRRGRYRETERQREGRFILSTEVVIAWDQDTYLFKGKGWVINKDFNKVTRDIESLGSLRTERLRY